jgi:acetaldehyde dehydrogenase
MGAHFDSPDISMVSCGGQATIPIVAAVSRVATVHYAEIVSSIASKSAGPSTRANIDEFTQTTARAIEIVGGAHRGKAIIVLNPAEPPMMMRNTIFCLSDEADTAEIARSIEHTVDEVRDYVGGYRLKQEVQFDRIGTDNAMILHGVGVFTGIKTSVFLEVQGSAHYLPSYAGNLDIMTSAALSTAERLAERNWS